MTTRRQFWSVRYLRSAAAFCWLIGVIMAVSLIITMFRRPWLSWDLIQDFLGMWAWFYVASLHWTLAKRPAVTPEREEVS